MLERMSQYLQLLQQITSDVDFNELSEALGAAMKGSSIYILGRKGRVLGYSLEDGADSTPFDAEWLSEGVASTHIQSMATQSSRYKHPRRPQWGDRDDRAHYWRRRACRLDPGGSPQRRVFR